MNGEDLARAVDLAGVPGTSLPAGRYVEDGEVRRLVAACLADQSAGGRRDAAVLAALFVGGLRRAEAIALDVQHYEPASGHLTVTGKGRRQRHTALPAGGRRAMAAWLEVRDLDEGPLFCPVDKAGRVTIRRLTTQAVYALVDRRARKAGVSHLSPHDGRRTFASDLFDAGVDAVQVQGLMGHASLLTTGAYDRRPELARLATVERLHFPYPSGHEPAQDSADRTPVVGPADQAHGVRSDPQRPAETVAAHR
jgi:site-specific recombinase XerD